MSPGGSDPSTVTRINNRTPFDVLPSGEIVFAQRDYTDRYRVFSDLHVTTLDGAVRRVTRGARLTAPSTGPDGMWAVAVTEGGGTNGLARVDLRARFAADAGGVATRHVLGLPGGLARRAVDRRQPLDGPPARCGRPRCPRACGGRGDPRPGARPGAEVECRWQLPGLVVGPDRHPEHPGRGGRSAHRRRRPARPADERPYGSGVSERRSGRRVALLLGLPRRRLGGGAGPVRSGRRPGRSRPGGPLRRTRLSPRRFSRCRHFRHVRNGVRRAGAPGRRPHPPARAAPRPGQRVRRAGAPGP